MPSTSHKGQVRRLWIGGQTAGLTPFSISAWKPTRLLPWIWNHNQPRLIAPRAPSTAIDDPGQRARRRQQQKDDAEAAAHTLHRARLSWRVTKQQDFRARAG